MPKLQTLKPRLAAAPTRLKALTDTPNGWRTKGMGGTARGYDYRWQQARKRFLEQHPLCVMCEEAGRATVATVVDHKVAHRGNQDLFWDETNWQPLCATHHSSDKQRQENRKD